MKRGRLKVFDVIIDDGGEIKKTRHFAYSQNEVKECVKNAGFIPIKITKTCVEFTIGDLYNALMVLPEGGVEIYREVLNSCDIFAGDETFLPEWLDDNSGGDK